MFCSCNSEGLFTYDYDGINKILVYILTPSKRYDIYIYSKSFRLSNSNV